MCITRTAQIPCIAGQHNEANGLWLGTIGDRDHPVMHFDVAPYACVCVGVGVCTRVDVCDKESSTEQSLSDAHSIPRSTAFRVVNAVRFNREGKAVASRERASTVRVNPPASPLRIVDVRWENDGKGINRESTSSEKTKRTPRLNARG